MDKSATDITFDNYGFCNYCSDLIFRLNKNKKSSNKDSLSALLRQIKKDGSKKPYDCIVGVSGGVDSSWVLVKCIEYGLRPLAVHMDNGWNSELAQNNISNLIETLKVDLFTYVIDWQEYKKLMQAFFDADVIDIELLYDNAMLAVNYQQASKYGIKYILSGDNIATEGMRMPKGWNWLKFDKPNIKDIAHKGGINKFRTFPSIGIFDLIFYKGLKKNFKYKPYPYKHYESIFTRFYQGYILPNKFFIDKRKVHLSTLIINGEIDRYEALSILNNIAFPSEEEQEKDIQYFLKKMDWSQNDMNNYLSRVERKHDCYKSNILYWNFIKKTFNLKK